MAAVKENVIQVGAAVIKLYPRGNGKVSLSWSEGGRGRRTTRNNMEAATAWAKAKAKQLSGATGARWVAPAAADRIGWLETLAGGPEAAARLLAALEEAKAALGGDLTEIGKAAAWYAKHGPPAVERQTVHEAVEAFVLEYESHHPSSTYRPVRSELRSFAAKYGTMDLIVVGHSELSNHVFRAGAEGPPAKRTVRNRIAAWTTFFRRCEALGWWPEGKKHPSSTVKRPRLDDVAPPIFTPEVAGRLLALIEAEARQHLPFLLIAGWLGCRPSECQRLRMDDFDFKAALLHVRASVARKTQRERWVPMAPALARRLKSLFAEDADGALGARAEGGRRGAKGMACRHHSREAISAMARERGVIEVWPPDVLRHSFITYRLQVTGSIDKTAEEAGNSPAEIRASYRRPIPPGVAETWWSVLEEA